MPVRPNGKAGAGTAVRIAGGLGWASWSACAASVLLDGLSAFNPGRRQLGRTKANRRQLWKRKMSEHPDFRVFPSHSGIDSTSTTRIHLHDQVAEKTLRQALDFACNADGRRDLRVATALQVLENGKGVRLEDAARLVNLSSSRLRHLCRQELGVSALRYIKQRRLLRARELVQHTFLNIKEIMSAVGFADLSHFLRDYRTAFGETPSETRRMHSQSGH